MASSTNHSDTVESSTSDITSSASRIFENGTSSSSSHNDESSHRHHNHQTNNHGSNFQTNHTGSPSTNVTSNHNDTKERKFDLNSFTRIRKDDSDEDDKPLAVRKQKPTESSGVSPNESKLSPSRTADHGVNGGSNRKSTQGASLNKVKIEAQSPEKRPKHSPDADIDAKMQGSANKKPKVEDFDFLGTNDNKCEPKPIKARKPVKEESDAEDDLSLAERSKQSKKTHKEKEPKKRAKHDDYEESEDEKPLKKKKTKVLEREEIPSPSKSKPGKKKPKEEQQEVWKWWEEQVHQEGVKWKFLEHKGVMFAPPYEPLPSSVKFYYDGKPMKLSEDAEEVATFYSKMLSHDYVTKDLFNKNFFKDWRKTMNAKEKESITDLKKCDFKEMYAYFTRLSEERKARSKEEKLQEKNEKEDIQKEYGVAIIDGHKEKIGNFRIEPPGLFRGRGSHPKMGMLKRRIQPEDVIINCSKDSKIPPPPAGHKWKEVRHDNTVTWLASWSENIMGGIKYVMLNPSSKIKGEKDWQKYEVARKLKSKVHKMREQYKEDWKSKEMRIRQRAVALYFIDKLALRAGNEKEEGETADTVGCCSLRCEHIKLNDEWDGQECVVEFDFLGKDSIRYYNRVPVEKRVYKNLKLFMENKNAGDDLFDRLNTSILNKHLTTLMDGLTAKVFRTYNASFTLQQQLDLLTKADMSPAEKLLSYNRANRQVAILCNHQRAVPKAHGKQMESLQEKIAEKTKQVKEAKGERNDAKKAYKAAKNEKNKKLLEMKEKQYERMQDQLQKLEVKATDKEENKEISLGTSKLNYLDPRISVAWCKKWEIPIEKVYNKTQREKFRWAIDMAGPEFSW